MALCGSEKEKYLGLRQKLKRKGTDEIKSVVVMHVHLGPKHDFVMVMDSTNHLHIEENLNCIFKVLLLLCRHDLKFEIWNGFVAHHMIECEAIFVESVCFVQNSSINVHHELGFDHNAMSKPHINRLNRMCRTFAFVYSLWCTCSHRCLISKWFWICEFAEIKRK